MSVGKTLFAQIMDFISWTRFSHNVDRPGGNAEIRGTRSNPMGRINAVFKADGDETRARYSISEWWLEPHTKGSGKHAHEEDDVFYVTKER